MGFLGRQFNYDTALEIIQEEDYLEDSDFDEIKRYDTIIEIRNFSPDSIYPNHIQHGDRIPAQNQPTRFEKYNHNSLSYNANRAQNHQYHYRKKRNEPISIDFDELKSRVKRVLGNYLSLAFLKHFILFFDGSLPSEFERIQNII